MIRRRAVAWGMVVVAVYAVTAIVSGHLSVLARRPLLDGLVPPTPYRWAEPPPELAASNLDPTPGAFEVELGRPGTDTTVLTTEDVQVTLVMPRGAFEAVEGERAVAVRVEPLPASAVTEPGGDRAILGNVYRIEAEYVPSGNPAELAEEVRAILVYPFVSNDHGGHELLVSPDGTAWEAVETNDLPSIQQADGPIGELGYVTVGRDPTRASSPQDDGPSSVAVVAAAGALIALAVGVAVLLWPRKRPARTPTRASGSATKRTKR